MTGNLDWRRAKFGDARRRGRMAARAAVEAACGRGRTAVASNLSPLNRAISALSPARGATLDQRLSSK
jgi:hypothetical protein